MGERTHAQLRARAEGTESHVGGGAEARHGAAPTERGEGEGSKGAEVGGGVGGGKGEATETEETCCEAGGAEQGACDARRYCQGELLDLFIEHCSFWCVVLKFFLSIWT